MPIPSPLHQSMRACSFPCIDVAAAAAAPPEVRLLIAKGSRMNFPFSIGPYIFHFALRYVAQPVVYGYPDPCRLLASHARLFYPGLSYVPEKGTKGIRGS